MPPRKGVKNHTDRGPRGKGEGLAGKECRVVSSGAERAANLGSRARPSRYAIQTDLIFTNSRMPYSESSRP